MGEQRLIVAVFGCGLVIAVEAAVEPTLGEVERLGGVFAQGRRPGALVEGHHDVGADRAFGIDNAFGGEEVLRAVDVRSEMAPSSFSFRHAARKT